MPVFRLCWAAPLFFALILASACAPPDDGSDSGIDPRTTESLDHDHGTYAFLSDSLDEFGDWRPDRPFRQVSFLIETDEPTAPRLDYRYRTERGAWSDWGRVEITWSDGPLHVGRVVLEQTGTRFQIRRPAHVETARLEFLSEVRAQTEVLTRDLPYARYPELALDPSRIAGVAPASLVIPRAEWGARDPDKVCGSPHDPYRMSIHHTALPDSDGGDPAARMRQMQAYHIDNNGWCDIGYHFVVSQSGLIFQGRSTETRTGAHVGNQNAGNIGISLIGNYQRDNPGQTQLDATMSIVGWVHETYQIPLNRDAVKGHREWPGQTTSCPGDKLLARIDDILAGAADGGATRDAELQVNYLGLEDFYPEGSSAGVPDVFPGDSFQAEILLTNRSSVPLRNTKIHYWFEAPFLAATKYVIQTDHPAYDGMTWMINDADSAPENPSKDQMGDEGTLAMYAFSTNETKRIVVDLTAQQYSIGAADHPDVRAWVEHIDDLYGEQTAWNQDPTNANLFEKLLQGFAQLDVLSRDEWQFDGGDAELREGWTSCNHISDLVIEPGDGTLRGKITGDSPCIISPDWTSIDADTWDQLVLRVGVDSAGASMAIYWAGVGEALSASRAVTFVVPGKEMETLVIPLGEHEAWAGEISKLRIDPVSEGASEGDTFSIDAIFLQSSSGEVASAREDHVDAEPVRLSSDKPVPPPGGGAVDDDPLAGDEIELRVNEGCSSVAALPSPWPLLLLLGFGLFRWRRL